MVAYANEISGQETNHWKIVTEPRQSKQSELRAHPVWIQILRILQILDTPSTDLATINITISGSIVRHIGWQPRIACKWNRSHKNNGYT